MSTPLTGIFLEPTGTLRQAILERKAWLKQRCPRAAYCDHPPHCTLLFGDYGDPLPWLDSLRETIRRHPPWELRTEGWQEFPADTLAGGGHTVAFRAERSSAVVELQQAIAQILAPHRGAHAPAHPLARTEPFATSLRLYGAPFVGAHWIPHFTVGSPLVSAGDPLLTGLMSGPTRHGETVRTLSVWAVRGEHHERLHELALAQPKT